MSDERELSKELGPEPKPSPAVERLAEFFMVPVVVQLKHAIYQAAPVLEKGYVPTSSGQALCYPGIETTEDGNYVASDVIAPAILKPEHTGTCVRILQEYKKAGVTVAVTETVVAAEDIAAVTLIWSNGKQPAPQKPSIILTK
jgi:hypothetical protein